MKTKLKFIGLLMIATLTVASILPQLSVFGLSDMGTVEASQTISSAGKTMWLWTRITSQSEVPTSGTYRVLMIASEIPGYYYLGGANPSSGACGWGDYYLAAIQADSRYVKKGQTAFLTPTHLNTPFLTFTGGKDGDNANASKCTMSFQFSNFTWNVQDTLSLQIGESGVKKNGGKNYPGKAILFRNVKKERDHIWEYEYYESGAPKDVYLHSRKGNGDGGPKFDGDNTFYFYIGEEVELNEITQGFEIGAGETVSIEGRNYLRDGQTITVNDGGSLIIDGAFYNQGQIKVSAGGTLVIKNNSLLGYLWEQDYDWWPSNQFLVSDGSILVEKNGYILSPRDRACTISGNCSTFGSAYLYGALEDRWHVVYGKYAETTISSNLVNNGYSGNLNITDYLFSWNHDRYKTSTSLLK